MVEEEEVSRRYADDAVKAIAAPTRADTMTTLEAIADSTSAIVGTEK